MQPVVQDATLTRSHPLDRISETSARRPIVVALFVALCVAIRTLAHADVWPVLAVGAVWFVVSWVSHRLLAGEVDARRGMRLQACAGGKNACARRSRRTRSPMPRSARSVRSSSAVGGTWSSRREAKTCTAEGQVTVRVEDRGMTCRIVVEDNGRGIPTDVMPHIFEPFFTTKATGQGTGLGLPVSLGIVEQHGGTLVAENRAKAEGGGARFIVELSVVDAAADDTGEMPVVRPGDAYGSSSGFAA